MPGPKPNPAIAFRDLYKAAVKLRVASESTKQNNIVNALIAGLRNIEPAWHIKRTPKGDLDLGATNHYNTTADPISLPKAQMLLSPYDQGWRDYELGQTDNPHAEDTMAWSDWGRGYFEAEQYASKATNSTE